MTHVSGDVRAFSVAEAKQGRTGKVYLVGAGPGDVELLTLKAARILREADVVLIDDLVNPEMLRFLRPGAPVLKVGKRGGYDSTPQALLHAKMIALADDGKCVVRMAGLAKSSAAQAALDVGIG